MTRQRAVVAAVLLSAGLAGIVVVVAPRYAAMLPTGFLGLIGVASIATLLAVRDLSRRNAILLIAVAAACIGTVVAFMGFPFDVHL